MVNRHCYLMSLVCMHYVGILAFIVLLSLIVLFYYSFVFRNSFVFSHKVCFQLLPSLFLVFVGFQLQFVFSYSLFQLKYFCYSLFLVIVW